MKANFKVVCKVNGVVKSESFRTTEAQVKSQTAAWLKLGDDHTVEVEVL